MHALARRSKLEIDAIDLPAAACLPLDGELEGDQATSGFKQSSYLVNCVKRNESEVNVRFLLMHFKIVTVRKKRPDDKIGLTLFYQQTGSGNISDVIVGDVSLCT